MTPPEDDKSESRLPAGNADSTDSTQRIIEAFGGIRPMATKVGVPVSTVQGWKSRGVIPANRHAEVRAAAKQHGIELSEGRLAVTDPEVAEETVESAEPAPAAGAPADSGTGSADPATAGSGGAWSQTPVTAGRTAAASAPPDDKADDTAASDPAAETAGGPGGNGQSGGGDDGPPPASGAPAPQPVPAARGRILAPVSAVIAVVAMLIAVTANLWQPYVAPRLQPVFERWVEPMVAVVFGEPAPSPTEALRRDLAAVETQLAELEAGLSERVADAVSQRLAERDTADDVAELSETVSATQDRLAELESALGDMRSGASERAEAIAALRTDLTELANALEDQPDDNGDASAGLSAEAAERLDTVEARLGELADQVAQATARETADPEAVTQLTERVAALEDEVASLAENRLRRSDVQAMLADRDESDVAALESRVSDLADRVDTIAGTVEVLRGQERQTQALAMAAARLQAALNGNQGFEDALATLRSVGGDQPTVVEAIETLSPHAESGIPTIVDLRERFQLLAGDVIRAAYRSVDGGWWDEAVAQMRSLVTVRPTADRLEGNGPEQRVARAEAALQRDDLAGAVRHLDELRGPAADAVAAWLADARARLQAEAAINDLADAAIRELAGSGDGDGEEDS